MTTAKRISGAGGSHVLVALVVAVAAVAAFAPTAQADPPGRVSVTGNVDIQVWLDQPMDIYPSYGDVVVSVQANRGCYATVFVVDTFGYVHVIHPFSPDEDAWIAAGVTYRLNGRDIGLDRFGGRGIVHVFAIGSPYPFDYSPYGEFVFAGRYGYRIYGDPYVACRQFYATLLPAAHQWNRVGIGSARFYVRDWVRYPVYLCHCSHERASYVRVGRRCHSCGSVYDTYRVHVNDPQVALRRTPRYKDSHRQSYANTRVERSVGVERSYKSTFERNRSRATVKSTAHRSRIVSAKRTDNTVTVKRARAAKQTKVAHTVKTKSQSTTVKNRATKTTNKKGRVSR